MPSTSGIYAIIHLLLVFSSFLFCRLTLNPISLAEMGFFYSLSKSAEGGLPDSFSKNEFDNLEYRQQLIDTYGEDLVIQYEKKFDEWVKGKKTTNVNKYFEIDKWLCEDFG
jgi:hypothetical protein